MDEDTLELMQMLHDTCVKEINIDESKYYNFILRKWGWLLNVVISSKTDLIVEARKGNFANDPKLMCYMKCLFVTLGPVSKNRRVSDTNTTN